MKLEKTHTHTHPTIFNSFSNTMTMIFYCV